MATGITTLAALRFQRGAKRQYPDSLVFWRIGDSFTTFGEDAKTASGPTGMTATTWTIGHERVLVTGFPAAAAQRYCAMLTEAGHAVILCDAGQETE